MLAIVFYFFAVISIIAALSVVVSRSPIYSALSLVVTFFAIAAQYILLNAQFVAAVQIMVYAGAIMVLFLFVIMLLNLNQNTDTNRSDLVRVLSVGISAGIMITTLVGAVRSAGTLTPLNPSNDQIGLIANLGKTLFDQFLLPFEVSSLLFLSAMVGAIMLGKKEAS